MSDGTSAVGSLLLREFDDLAWSSAVRPPKKRKSHVSVASSDDDVWQRLAGPRTGRIRIVDVSGWPFFTSEPAQLSEFMHGLGIERDVVEVSRRLGEQFGTPPSVSVTRDPTEGDAHVSIRMPTTMDVAQASALYEQFLESYWIDHEANSIVVDLEFV